MTKVMLDVTQDNLIDFHHLMPVITGEKPFRFVVDKWDSDDITELSFSEFRANSNHLNPMGLMPVEFKEPLQTQGDLQSWTIRKADKPWKTEPIELAPNPIQDDRRLIDFTLRMTLANGTSIAIDPPLDERRRGG